MKRQTPKNSTHLRQVEGGKTIKQNDRSSNFVYKLLDEHGEIIPALEGEPAEVALIKETDTGELEVVFGRPATVVEGRVDFTIHRTLEAGIYFVEVACAGYIFPSKNTVTIEVTKSAFGIVRKGTRLHERTAYANISKGENVAQAGFFDGDLGVGMSKELADGKQLITSSSLHSAVAYSTLNNVEAGDYEISIRARKTSDEATAIRFGLENLGQMREFSNIAAASTEYSFIATVDKLYSTLYCHFRTNGSVELESIQIRKVAISDLSWEDSGQSHVGVAHSKEETIPLEYSRFEWKEKE